MEQRLVNSSCDFNYSERSHYSIIMASPCYFNVCSSLDILLMRKCTEFCQSEQFTSNLAVEQLLERIVVQRCYDPFSLLNVVSQVSSRPLHSQPDLIVLMDWTSIAMAFMTNSDLFWHKRQFSLDTANLKEAKSRYIWLLFICSFTSHKCQCVYTMYVTSNNELVWYILE